METFVIKVWADDAGVPGEQIDTMYQFHSPQYFTEGYDLFAYYAYDNPVPVSGIIHVGFIQQNVDRLNIGLDKNSNANAGNLHYKLGPGSNWLASEIPGSVMIHPVLRAGKVLPSSIDVIETVAYGEISSELYPNPTSSEVSFETYEDMVWSVYSLSGRELMRGESNSSVTVTIDTSDLPAGVYWVRMTTTSTSVSSGKKLIILPQ